MESTTVEGICEGTDKKINDICSMPWLKRNSQTLTECKNCTVKEIVPKSQNMEDYVPGTKTGKKRKPKRSKSNIESTENASKDANSKNSDTDTEQSSRKHGKRNSKSLQFTAITLSSSNTVWNAKTSAASALFPVSQAKQIEILDDEVLLSKALEESIITAQLEKFRLTTDEVTDKNTKENKVNWADDSEDPVWGAACRNLPEPSEEKDKDSEKQMEKKSHDDNNNSDNKSSTAKEQYPKGVDKYGRVGGFNERHLFMGRGARMKEQQIIEYQNRTGQGSFNRRSPVSIQEKSDSEPSSKIDSYDNRRGHRDFGERNSNDNRFSNFEDRREYRNRNFQSSNHRGRFENQLHRYDNHPNRYDNYPHRYENQPQKYNYQQRCESQPKYEHHPPKYESHPQKYENYPQKYQNQTPKYDNHPQKYEHQPQKYEHNPQRFDNQQHRYDNQHRRYDNQTHSFGNNHRRDFPNRDQNHDQSPHEREFRDMDSNKFENKNLSTPETDSDKNTIEIQDSPEKESEDQFKKLQIEPVKLNLSRSSTPILEESSSLCFMQESFKDEENESYEKPVQNSDRTSETTSEQSECPSSNPFEQNVRAFPIHVLHPPGMMCPNPEGNVQIHNGMTYTMLPNPFMIPVPGSNPPHFQHQHTHEMVTSESGCPAVPIQNLDMRFFPPLHNHPVNSFVPISNYPVGMPMHSCGQLPQMPVGNVPGMNFMHQHPVNCQQCPPHYCQSQRIPLQNLNCQNSVYPGQFLTPMTSVALPVAPTNPEQIISQPGRNLQPGKCPQPDKMGPTPATEIERSVSNLVSLCENLPARRGYSSNCPPGFESNACSTNPSATQRKIIFDKEQAALPSFRNNPKYSAQENSRKSSKKSEEFTDEKLKNIYEEINMNSKRVEKEDVNRTSTKWSENIMKFNEDSYHGQLMKSYLQPDKKPPQTNNQAPRPGFRVGFGRGKRLGHTT